jgi:SnoaL-like domain
MSTLDEATVRMLERHWEEGWNRRDLDLIMEPFAPDVRFSSPGISIVTRDPSRSTIEGHDALRAYIENALRFAAEVRYSLSATYTGTDSIVIVYACTTPGGTQKLGADLMRVDDTGKVVEWRCHY